MRVRVTGGRRHRRYTMDVRVVAEQTEKKT